MTYPIYIVITAVAYIHTGSDIIMDIQCEDLNRKSLVVFGDIGDQRFGG